MERFADLRRSRGQRGEPAVPAAVGERLARAARDDVLVMHPFLMLDEAWWEQVRGLLEVASR